MSGRSQSFPPLFRSLFVLWTGYCSQIAAVCVSATTAFDRRYGHMVHCPDGRIPAAPPTPAPLSQITITPRSSAAVDSNINKGVYTCLRPRRWRNQRYHTTLWLAFCSTSGARWWTAPASRPSLPFTVTPRSNSGAKSYWNIIVHAIFNNFARPLGDGWGRQKLKVTNSQESIYPILPLCTPLLPLLSDWNMTSMRSIRLFQ